MASSSLAGIASQEENALIHLDELSEVLNVLQNQVLKLREDVSILTRQEISHIENCIELLATSDDRLARNTLKRRACRFLQAANRHSGELFLLCAMASLKGGAIGNFSKIKTKHDIDRVMDWWNSTSQCPPRLQALYKEFSLKHNILRNTDQSLDHRDLSSPAQPSIETKNMYQTILERLFPECEILSLVPLSRNELIALANTMLDPQSKPGGRSDLPGPQQKGDSAG